MEFLANMLGQQNLFGNSLLQWLIALGIGTGVFLLGQTVKVFIIKRINIITRHTRINIDDAVAHMLTSTNSFLLLLLAVYAGSLWLQLPDDLELALHTTAIIVLIIQIGIWINSAITFWINDYQQKALQENAAQVTTMQAIGYIVRVVIFSLLLLLALDNIPGVEVTPLLASLGVVGIAVSLALQSVLADLFASIAIALDKPFVINDFIIVGDFLGTVEKIGVKTTRLRSLGGEQLVFPNSDLINSRIRNYQRMQERRIVFSLGVTYTTPYEKLSRIPQIIQQAVEAAEQARFDRAHFASYGDFSLNFEVVYYVLSADYNRYMDVQQAINLAIFQSFAQEGIDFAFPTQTLYLARNEQANGVHAEGTGQPVQRAEPQGSTKAVYPQGDDTSST